MGNMILAAGTPLAKSSGSSGFNVILIIVVLFGVLYFVMIRPQRNRQRKVQEQQSQVQPGQRVRTTAGMYATVVDVDGDDVILEVSPGVEVRYVKRAIMQVLPDEDGAQAEPGYAAEDESTDEAYDEAADREAADREAAGHEAAGYGAAGYEAAGYEAAGREAAGPEAAGPEAAVHDDDQPVAHAGEQVPPHSADKSPNGPPGAADESRTQGTL